MGCPRVPADRLGLTLLGYISCEIDKAAKRVVLLRCPGVIKRNNIESVYREVVNNTMQSFAGLTSVVWLGAGSPCQDLSGLNASRQCLSGSRSGLFHHVPRIIHLISEVAKLPIHWMVENVASVLHSALVTSLSFWGSSLTRFGLTIGATLRDLVYTGCPAPWRLAPTYHSVRGALIRRSPLGCTA